MSPVKVAYAETQKPKQSRSRYAKEQPGSMTVTIGDVAWWVGLDRSAFSAQAASRANAMRVSKENRTVQYRILQ